MPPLLLVGTPMQQRRSEQPDSGASKWHAAANRFELLLANNLLCQGASPAAIFAGPGDSQPSACIKLPMPVQDSVPIGFLFIGEGPERGHGIVAIAFEPLPELRPKCLICGAEVKIH